MTRGATLRALAAGFGASLVLTALMLALRLRLNAPSFPERIDDLVLLLIPQALFSETLERLGFAAKPFLFVALVIAQLLLATIGGLLYGLTAVRLAGRMDLTHPFLGGAVGLFASVATDLLLLPAIGAATPLATLGWPAAAPALAIVAVPGLGYGVALASLLRLLSPPRATRAPNTGKYGVSRGSVTRRTASALILSAVGMVVTADSLRRIVAGMRPRQSVIAAQVPTAPTSTPRPSPTAATPAPTPNAPPTPTATPLAATNSAAPGTASPPIQALPASPTAATPTPAATPLPTQTPLAPTPTPLIPPGVATAITPNAEFYTISKNFLDPLIVANSWQLTLGGLLGQPRTLRHADLLALPTVSQATTLTCISNEIGGELIGNATWTGVSLGALLASAALRPEATHIVFTCADDYIETLPIARALDPATLLAHTMNGLPLTETHGFPIRLIAPGRYGMKNPKWIVRIEATNRPPVGYWTERGWSPDEPIQTSTRIDIPGFLQTLPSGPTWIGGVAFAGDRGISRVEVSTDNGTSWQAAQLEAALGPATWVRWALPWTPLFPGSYTLLARAYDGNGTPQTANVRKSGPGGATGYARQEVTVTS